MKAYYTAGVIYDALLSFGELSEEATDKRKYAKYKAAYIHTCLKNGEAPIPGPPEGGDSDDNNIGVGASTSGNDDASAASPTSPSNEPGPSSDPPADYPIEFQPHPNPAEINGICFYSILFFVQSNYNKKMLLQLCGCKIEREYFFFSG